MKRLLRFKTAEDGAITVDWVVLTAILIGVVMSVFVLLTPTVYENAAEGIRENVDEAAQR
jgi:multisubunit Na+/H+ antiporter MnhC subunit